jgi:hemoglobin-like flavoprotein
MIDQEIRIVQDTWSIVRKKEDPSIGVLFYTRLFENSPQLKALFNNDVEIYGERFESMMNYVIDQLNDTNLIPNTRTYMQQYSEYYIQFEHYECMKEALFWSLRKKLEDRWNPNVMVSWIWFLSILGYMMKQGGRETAS